MPNHSTNAYEQASRFGNVASKPEAAPVIDMSLARASMKGIDLWRSLDETWMDSPLPPPQRMAVAGTIPLGKAGTLVGMGKVGKTTAVDDLLFKGMYPLDPEGMGIHGPRLERETDEMVRAASALRDPTGNTWMGNDICKGGFKVMLITKESSFADMTRQFHRFEVKARRDAWRERNGDKRRCALMPSSYANVILEAQHGRMVRTDAFKAMEDYAHEFFDGKPGIIVLDTLSKLVRANFDSSTSETAATADELDSLAERTGAGIIGLYHTSKTKEAFKNQEEFRYGIKGSAGLVDGLRYALGMWRPWDALLNAVLECELAVKPSQVIMFGVPANNIYEMNAAAERPRVMVRTDRFGQMHDVTQRLEALIGLKEADCLLRGMPIPKPEKPKADRPAKDKAAGKADKASKASKATDVPQTAANAPDGAPAAPAAPLRRRGRPSKQAVAA